MNLIRAFNPRLYDLTERYRPTQAQMPWAYQPKSINPNGREFRNDWAFFKSTTRLACARRFALPYRITHGVGLDAEIPWDPSYPTAPGFEVFDKAVGTDHGAWVVMPHIKLKMGGYGLCRYEGWDEIDKVWVPDVFMKYTGIWFGKRLSSYRGMLGDLHVSPPDINGVIRSDLMCSLEPPITASWVPES